MIRILVPTDFSAVSINALNYAAQLAAKLNGKLILFHAFQVPAAMSEIPMITMPYDELKKISEDRLKELTADISHINSGVTEITAVCSQGMVHEELENIVEQEKPFAVVMGTRGSGGLERIFMGSNSLNAIRTLRCPVFVIPPGAVYKQIEKIGLAIDFKAVGDSLPVSYISELCSLFSAKLYVLNVDRNDAHFTPDTPQEFFNIHQQLNPLNPEYHYIDHADIDQGIHRFAETHNIDLIITLPKKHSLLENLFQKSHTADLVFHSHIPICSIHL